MEAPGATSAEEAAYSGTPELVITRKGEEVMRIPFDGGEKIIGREATADVHLDDRALSRKHAKVEKRGAAIWVSDLGSANGTYVNGEKLEAPRRLHQGDLVSVGHYKIAVEGTAAASEKMPVLTLTGPEGTHRFAMVGEHIVIGRSQSCDISIGHKSISRRHVRLGVKDDGFFVEDLGSQNGCKLNGKQLKGTAPLVTGDRIDICDFSVTLGYLDDPPASQEGTPKPGGPGRPSTMLIDKSAMAQAAYVDGDFENVRSRVLSKSNTSGKGAKLETGDYDLPQSGAPKKVRKKKKRAKAGK
jgi:pSer/pThr/pTyr-binding forkhead associated (FHA) protein